MSLCFKTILRNKVRLYLVRDNGILALQMGSSEASEVVKPVFLSKVSKVVLFMETISFFRFAKKGLKYPGHSRLCWLGACRSLCHSFSSRTRWVACLAATASTRSSGIGKNGQKILSTIHSQSSMLASFEARTSKTLEHSWWKLASPPFKWP
mgnify:CR=1 FL=1